MNAEKMGDAPKWVDREVARCQSCGSGPAKHPGQYTSASFSGVEVTASEMGTSVWCGTCGASTGVYESEAEALSEWNEWNAPND